MKWKQKSTCKSCGEAAHVYSCPKPANISKSKWQKMTDEQRVAVEEKST